MVWGLGHGLHVEGITIQLTMDMQPDDGMATLPV